MSLQQKMHWLIIFLIFPSLIFGSCFSGSIPWKVLNIVNCYTFHNENQKYTEAILACETENGELASVHEGFTNTFLAREFLLFDYCKDFTWKTHLWGDNVCIRDSDSFIPIILESWGIDICDHPSPNNSCDHPDNGSKCGHCFYSWWKCL